MGVFVGASEGAGTLTEAFTSALATIQTDVMSYIKVALPVGLAIFGTILAIRLGMKFFRQVAK